MKKVEADSNKIHKNLFRTRYPIYPSSHTRNVTRDAGVPVGCQHSQRNLRNISYLSIQQKEYNIIGAVTAILFTTLFVLDEVVPDFVAYTGSSLARLILPVMILLVADNFHELRTTPGFYYFGIWLLICSFSFTLVYLNILPAYSVQQSQIYLLSYFASLIGFRTIFQYGRQINIFKTILLTFLISSLITFLYVFSIKQSFTDLGRLTGTLSNSNGLGRMIAFNLIIVFYFIIRGSTWLIPVASFLGIMLLNTGSRGALFSLIISSCVLFFLQRKLVNKKAGTALIAIIGGGLTWYIFSQTSASLVDRLKSTISFENGLETAHRFEIAIASLHLIADNLIIGTGIGQSQNVLFRQYGQYLPELIFILMNGGTEINTHNTYLFVLAETGLLGFIPFSLALFQILKSAIQSCKLHKPFSHLSLTLLAFLFICGLTGTLMGQKLWWFGLGLAAAGVSTKD